MKPYDPKLNPGKSLEETINNFIEWIRMSNRNTTSVLRSVNEKLDDLSTTEANLKSLEVSQIAGLEKIENLLGSISQITDDTDSPNGQSDSISEMHDAIVLLTSQLKEISKSFANYQETINSQFTQGMNTIEKAILVIKSDISVINSQLEIPIRKSEPSSVSERTIQQELSKIRSQIVCLSEQDKANILTIIDNLISDLSTDLLEISGLDLKMRLVEARTQVYEQTEGLAPRFRIMIDNFMGVVNEDTLYSKDSLKPLLIEGLQHIREVYHSAPVGNL